MGYVAEASVRVLRLIAQITVRISLSLHHLHGRYWHGLHQRFFQSFLTFMLLMVGLLFFLVMLFIRLFKDFLDYF